MHPVISSLRACYAALDVRSHYAGSVIGHLPWPLVTVVRHSSVSRRDGFGAVVGCVERLLPLDARRNRTSARCDGLEHDGLEHDGRLMYRSEALRMDRVWKRASRPTHGPCIVRGSQV